MIRSASSTRELSAFKNTSSRCAFSILAGAGKGGGGAAGAAMRLRRGGGSYA